MRFPKKQERNTSLYDMINVNSPEMDVDKTQKTIPLTLGAEEHPHSSPVSTTTANQLNISFEDNFIYTYTSPQDMTFVVSNYQRDSPVTLPVTSNAILYYSDIASDGIPMQDDDISTDSDNENMPEISYQDELQSRYYYYESFTQQEVPIREVTGCGNPNETIRRIISFDDLNETTSQEMDSSDDDKWHDCFNSPVTCGPTFKTTPLANSSMIMDNEDSIFTDVGDFVPCLWSTEVNHSFQNSSAGCSLMNRQINCHLQANMSSGTESCHSPTDLHDKLANNISLCCTHDSLHAIASSSLSRDEFSIDSQDAVATNGNRTLPCASRFHDINYNLSLHEPRRVETSIHSRSNRVPKQTFTILRALQAMKNVAKNVGKKSKNVHKQISMTDRQKPREETLEINLQDKKTVAKKLHRFRESFRRKDMRQIKTLATL